MLLFTFCGGLTYVVTTKPPSFRRYMDFNATFAAGSAVQHHREFDASSETADAATTRSSGVRAGVTLAVRTAPANTYFGMGLGKNGGLLDTWFAGRSTEAQWASWIVFDFGFEVSIDGLKLHTYGDGLHEPVKRPPTPAYQPYCTSGCGWAAV